MTAPTHETSTPARASREVVSGRRQRDTRTLIAVAVLSLLAILTLVPLYYLVVTTLKTSAEASASPLGLPTGVDFTPYLNAFAAMSYPRAFFNTLIITVGAVTGTILVSALAGYALSRNARSRIATAVFFLILAGMMFPYQMSILGLYQVVRDLHIMDTHLALVLIDITVNLPFSTFLFFAFTKTIPLEMEEAAMLDGAGTWRRFFTIVFPLLGPVVATVAILTTLSVWNDFMGPLYFLQSRGNQVLLQEVYRNVGQFSIDWTSLFPMMVLAVLPLLVFYVVMQKRIIGGVTAGSLKG